MNNPLETTHLQNIKS